MKAFLIDAPSRAHLVQRGELEKDMPAAAQVGAGNYPMSLLRAIDWAMKVDERERPQSVAEMRAVLAGGDEKQSSRKPKRAATSSPSQSKPRGANKISLLTQWMTRAVREVGDRAVKVNDESSTEDSLPGILKRARNMFLMYASITVVVFLFSAFSDFELFDVGGVFAWSFTCFTVYLLLYTNMKWLVKHIHILSWVIGVVMVATFALSVSSPGNTPLHHAAQRNAANAALFFIANGVDVNARGRGGRPLHEAARKNAAAVARILLANGADANLLSWRGTPLHIAAKENAVEVAKILLANGADVNAENSDSTWTPLDYATWKGHNTMQSLLRQHGGQCNRQCN